MDWYMIFIIFLLFVIYLYTVHIPRTHVQFMSREETIEFLRNDPDGYSESLTSYDIKALHSTSLEEYTNRSCDDALDFTPSQKEYLRTCCEEADLFFREELQNRFPHVNGKVIANMKWKLALTKGEWYEEGYPHTRMDIIFITPDVISSKGCTRILVHEKVHVYERMFPSHVDKWMKSSGYIPHKRMKEYRLRRSNPDLDGWVYKDKKGRETIAIFKNETPSGIDDSIYLGGKDWKHEHPYETLAYKIDYFFGNEAFDE